MDIRPLVFGFIALGLMILSASLAETHLVLASGSAAASFFFLGRAIYRQSARQ